MEDATVSLAQLFGSVQKGLWYIGLGSFVFDWTNE